MLEIPKRVATFANWALVIELFYQRYRALGIFDKKKKNNI